MNLHERTLSVLACRVRAEAGALAGVSRPGWGGWRGQGGLGSSPTIFWPNRVLANHLCSLSP